MLLDTERFLLCERLKECFLIGDSERPRERDLLDLLEERNRITSNIRNVLIYQNEKSGIYLETERRRGE